MKIILFVLGVIALSLIGSEVFSLAALSILMVAGLISLFNAHEKKGDR